MKQGLGGSSSYDPLKMMKCISMIAAMKRPYMFSSSVEEDFFEEKTLIRDPMMK
jgi:hypothetical protein